MTVQKFRSIGDMNAATPRRRSQEDVDRFFRHCARFWMMAPRRYPRGVFKFRNVEEAQADRQRHTRC